MTFDRTYLSLASDNQNDVIQDLIHLLDQRNEPWVDELPIVINDKGEYEFCRRKRSRNRRIKRKKLFESETLMLLQKCACSN